MLNMHASLRTKRLNVALPIIALLVIDKVHRSTLFNIHYMLHDLTRSS